MGDYMKTASVTPSVRMFAEETKTEMQTVDGRISELISKGVKYEQENE
jgi:hypothetical protein